MARLIFAWLMGAASTACALAAVGWTLYAGSPSALWAAQCFGAFGFAAGLLCGALHLHFDGLPRQAPQALPPEALAGLVRATLATALAERQGRPGSPADRKTAVADSPAAVPGAGPVPAAGPGLTGVSAPPAVEARQVADSLT